MRHRPLLEAPQPTAERLAYAAALYATGEPVNSCAGAIGCTKSQFREYLRANGIPLRKSGRTYGRDLSRFCELIRKDAK